MLRTHTHTQIRHVLTCRPSSHSTGLSQEAAQPPQAQFPCPGHCGTSPCLFLCTRRADKEGGARLRGKGGAAPGGSWGVPGGDLVYALCSGPRVPLESEDS